MQHVVDQIQVFTSFAGLVASVALVSIMTRSIRRARRGENTLFFEFGLAWIGVLGAALIATSAFAVWCGSDLIAATCTTTLGMMFVIVANRTNKQLAQERGAYRLMCHLILPPR
jgi:hypothetical protein